VSELESAIEALATETDFSGVVGIDKGDRVRVAKAYGLAHRGYGIPNDVETRFAIASGAKGFTALTVMAVIEDGALSLSTRARSVLGSDLPLIDDEVTIEQLLAHRSGIGDYLDEETELDLTDYLMPVPVYKLAATEDYLPALAAHEMKFSPGERFAYCNSGYVVLALIAERISGVAFHELVRSRVCDPAGMQDTAFLRSDELPERTAVGYLDTTGLRTNVFHLPVRGSGDGGIYSTAADMRAFWRTLFAGAIVDKDSVAEMMRPRSAPASGGRDYGLGFWLDPSTSRVMLVGQDAGVSFRSRHEPESGVTVTVLSNTSEGASPIMQLVSERLWPAPARKA
jgi:CubicO group peptidase (beta-lactamase class C family)